MQLKDNILSITSTAIRLLVFFMLLCNTAAFAKTHVHANPPQTISCVEKVNHVYNGAATDWNNQPGPWYGGITIFTLTVHTASGSLYTGSGTATEKFTNIKIITSQWPGPSAYTGTWNSNPFDDGIGAENKGADPFNGNNPELGTFTHTYLIGSTTLNPSFNVTVYWHIAYQIQQ